MSGGTLEPILSGIIHRWTIDSRTKCGLVVHSSTFPFHGAQMCLTYSTYIAQYSIALKKKSSESLPPFEVWVYMQSGSGRTVSGMLEQTRFTDEFASDRNHCVIWKKTEDEVVRADPEFGRDRLLRLVVILLKVEDLTLLDVPAIPKEVVRQPPPAASTSVRGTLDCCKSLSQDFSKLLERGLYLDVQFQCGGQPTWAHRAVVSARSEVIASMLAGNVAGVVKIPDMTPDVFRTFLRYLYTGSLPGLTPDLALQLYEAGRRYSVLGLSKRCSKDLLDHLTADSACRLLPVSDAHRDEVFKDAIIGFMLDKRVPASGAGWREFCDSHPKLATEVLNRFCSKLLQR